MQKTNLKVETAMQDLEEDCAEGAGGGFHFSLGKAEEEEEKVQKCASRKTGDGAQEELNLSWKSSQVPEWTEVLLAGSLHTFQIQNQRDFKKIVSPSAENLFNPSTGGDQNWTGAVGKIADGCPAFPALEQQDFRTCTSTQ